MLRAIRWRPGVSALIHLVGLVGLVGLALMSSLQFVRPWSRDPPPTVVVVVGSRSAEVMMTVQTTRARISWCSNGAAQIEANGGIAHVAPRDAASLALSLLAADGMAAMAAMARWPLMAWETQEPPTQTPGRAGCCAGEPSGNRRGLD